MRIHKVRLGGNEIRVIRPAPPPARLALRDEGHWLSLHADRKGSEQLVALWSLAARSARSLVHLPIRANAAPDGVASDGVPAPLDLVLLHHSLQFPTGSWKEVRARLGPGTPQVAATPDDDFPDESAVDHQQRQHPAHRDHLRFDIAARTLFVVGSATAFREHGTALRELVEEAPSHSHRRPKAGHCCAELRAGPWTQPWTRRNVPALLHVQYCADWRV
ncbi:hypothetical protein ABT025_03095 [Streptomyces sp. NPDC002809]|uniref:hypothetical protein n=1 Tax=Streptomyces sp. NPDC002809 TaxID=3154433 RepID=UPI003322FB70